MRYRIRILCCLLLLAASMAAAWGQAATRLTVSQRNGTLLECIKSIEAQTDYTFIFNNSIGVDKRVSVNLKNAPIDKVLKKVFTDNGISYSIQGKQIILSNSAMAAAPALALQQKPLPPGPAPAPKPGQQMHRPAQDGAILVRGKIMDRDGEPLPGASAFVRGGGPAKGATAGLDGDFALRVDPGDMLTVSFVGFQDQQFKIDQPKDLRIYLLEDAQMLEETVVIAYGTLEKKDITSSITSLKSDDLPQGLGGSTIATVLEGKIPGLTISGSASPNASNSFQLRGVASVNASLGPLVVIDGIPGGDFRAINPEDIESVDVLKDASAGAIYGTRAAGGVILVTTRKASEGKIKVTYTGELSTETVRSKPDLLSADEYRERKLGYDYGSSTDWYGELIREKELSQRHHLAISGGSKAAQVYTSILSSRQTGIMIGDARKDWAARMNGTFNLLDDRVQIRTHAEYRQVDRDNRINDNTIYMAITGNPTNYLMDPDNPTEYNVDKGFGSEYNPVADIEYGNYINSYQWILADASVKINLWKGLALNGVTGIDKEMQYRHQYDNALHRTSVSKNILGVAKHDYMHVDKVNYEAYLSYDLTVKDIHKINAVAGWSFWQKDNDESFSASNSNFAIDGLKEWDLAAGTYLPDGQASMESAKEPRERLLSLFARVNYNLYDRYLIQASIRREASSKFGPNNRWGTFYALSAGWRISGEEFMRDIRWINDLKVRAGYGVTGNNGFGTGYSTRQYTSYSWWLLPDKGVYAPTFGTAKNINPNLKWEEKAELNLGFDFAMFKNRLWGKFDIYWRDVHDLLYELNVPQPPYIYNKMMTNVGTLQNRGYEFELGGDIIRGKAFTWSTTFRMSHNTSKIINLGGDYIIDDFSFPSPGSPGNGVRLTNGSEIGKFWVYKYAGLTEEGKWMIYDKDGNAVPASDGEKNNLVAENRYFVGNAIPKAILSWDHNLHWKNWDLGIYMRSWLKYDVYSLVNMYFGIKRADESNVLHKAFEENAAINDEKIITDYFIEDGSFLKIDAVNLGYTWNLSRFNPYVDKVKIYFTGKDLFTFTKFSGIDPEIDINGLTPGFENFKDKDILYPRTRRFTLGVQLTF